MRICPSKEDRRLLGFTLIELLVTVVVLTVIAAIAVPIFLNQQTKASAAATQANLGVLASAIKTGFGLNTTPTVSGGVLSYVSEAGEQQVPLAGALVGLTSANSWCVEQEDQGGEQWVIDASMTTPQTGECEVNPSPPSNLVASAVSGSDDSVSLSWEAPSAPLSMPGGPQLGVLSPLATTLPTATYGSITYEIRRNGVLLTSTTNLFYTDQDLEPDTEYTYTIAAVNTRGGSTLVTATVRTNPTAPNTPTGLTATPLGVDSVEVEWDNMPRATSYTIQRDGEVVATGVVGTSLVDENLEAGTQYAYRVRAVGLGGWSGFSDPVNATTTGNSLAGTLDTSFTTPSIYMMDSGVKDMQTLSNGKILVAGNLQDAYGVSSLDGLFLMNPDGTRDTSFSISGMSGTYMVRDIEPTSDGKYIVVGEFHNIGGVAARDHVMRLNADASLDTTFTPAAITGGVEDAAIDSTGRIVLAGQSMTDVGGNASQDKIARLNADGSYDSTFAPLSMSNATRLVTMLASDQILVGGTFYNLGGVGSADGLARLNSDGTVDASFTPSATTQTIRFEKLSSGKILVLGGFDNAGGNPAQDKLIRLNTDGTLDTGFTPPVFTSGASTPVVTVGELPSGKLAVGGYFSQVNGSNRSRVAVLSADGTFEPSFNGPAFNEVVSYLYPTSETSMLVGGYFTNVSGRNYLISLN